MEREQANIFDVRVFLIVDTEKPYGFYVFFFLLKLLPNFYWGDKKIFDLFSMKKYL